MAYQIDWLMPGSIIYVYITDVMNVPETEEWMAKIYEMADELEQQSLIHTIVDRLDVPNDKQEVGLGDWKRIFSSYRNQGSPGWSITLANDAIQRFFGSLALQFLNIRGRQVKDIDEALDTLTQLDPELPPVAELKEAYNELRSKMRNNLVEAEPVLD